MTEAAASTSKLAPGMVLGPDGKPCKVCTGFKAWTGATKKKSSTAGGGKTPAASAAALAASPFVLASTSTSSAPSLPDDCPADIEQLGRHTWTFLHTSAAYYPEKPSPVHQSSMLSLLKSLPLLYPCSHCAGELGEYMAKNGPEEAVKGREGLERWLCGVHNDVNEKLGKEKFDCDRTGERWRDGWKDGRCD